MAIMVTGHAGLEILGDKMQKRNYSQAVHVQSERECVGKRHVYNVAEDILHHILPDSEVH